MNIQPKRILVITLRYLGDTLLITPLLASLRRAYPRARIDVLLPKGNIGMLEGNPDVDRLIPLAVKEQKFNFLKLLCRLFRRYDLSISTQAGDRPILCAIAAGKFSMGFVSDSASRLSWKRLLLGKSLEFTDRHTHIVLENLRFCDALGITPYYTLIPPTSIHEKKALPSKKYAVMHITPQWRYKQWHELGWVKVGYYLSNKGYLLVLTGSPYITELKTVSDCAHKLPPSTLNLAGKLSLAQLADIIRNAALFVGPDTGITHMAAATAVPTIAIFGPTDPKKWAPWPFGYAENKAPFVSIGTQHVNNVYLIQQDMPDGCVPCQKEGCLRNRLSHSACLDGLPAETILAVLAGVV